MGVSAEDLEAENVLMKFKQKVTSPRLAGTALLVHETMDQVRDPRQAWTYNTGQRRVRRALTLHMMHLVQRLMDCVRQMISTCSTVYLIVITGL